MDTSSLTLLPPVCFCARVCRGSFHLILSVVLNCREGRGEERVAKLVDSPDRPESEATYKLDEGGWADV